MSTDCSYYNTNFDKMGYLLCSFSCHIQTPTHPSTIPLVLLPPHLANFSLIHLYTLLLHLSSHHVCVIQWSCAVVNYNGNYESWREGLACGTQQI